MNYHDAKTRLKLCKDGIDQELTYAEEQGIKSPALVNASCSSYEDNEEHDFNECEACQNTAEFSGASCELCNNPLAGERSAVALIEPGTHREPLFYSVCVDCVYMLEYGQLDDMSMSEITD